eukprot:TRINITY_DN27226_c0_g2_i1.p1 TRINITY_DN27226_c0_g2~~TRINITY_DN27226_c0_g2_i1.p1  ORF type:complete len:287 (-),score=38.37 TRINITY_DN27226_c0_g2_i1:154-1014(-)
MSDGRLVAHCRTFAGHVHELPVTTQDSVRSLRERVAALLQLNVEHVLLFCGEKRLQPDNATLTQCGIEPSCRKVEISVLVTSSPPVAVLACTLRGDEQEFSFFPNESVGVVRRSIATWLGREAKSIVLKHMEKELLEDSRKVEESGLKGSRVNIAVTFRRPDPRQAVPFADLVAELIARKLSSEDEIAELLEDGQRIEQELRDAFSEKLRLADAHDAEAKAQKKAKDRASIALRSALHAKEALLQVRGKAMSESSGKPSHSQTHLNGRVSRALIGGGPITKSHHEW